MSNQAGITLQLGALILMMLIPCFIFAGGEIRGRVSGFPEGTRLAGAHVLVKGTGIGTITGPDGRFVLKELKPGKITLTFSFLGYQTAEKNLTIKEGQSLTFDITLQLHVLESPEVEISGIRSDRLRLDAPVRMEIISAKNIANTPGQSITAVLGYISGVNLSSTLGVYSSNTVVSMRGLSGNDQGRTLVLLDDIPLNKADAGSVNWNLVNRGNVEHIEITKGPGSAKYGSAAMGGVINIVSRQPVKVIGGDITMDYGTFNTFGIRGQASGKLWHDSASRGFYYGANGFFRRSDGYNPEIPEYLEKSDTFYVNTYLREVSVGARAGYRFNPDHSLEVNGNFFNDKRGRGVEIYEVDGAYDRHKTWQANIRYRGRSGRISWNALAYNQSEYFERLNEYMKEAEYNLYLVKSNRVDRGARAECTIPAGESHSLLAGIEYQYGSVDGKDIYYTSTDVISNAGKMDSWALFVQDEISPGSKKLMISLGLRMNNALFHDGSFLIEDPSYSIQYLVDYQDSLFKRTQWWQFDPKVSLRYKFSDQTRLYVTVARGFRAPNLDDLCRTGKVKNGFKVANPSLKPENLTNFETGADLWIFRKLHAAPSIYYSLGSDFMYYVSTGDSVNMGYKLTPVLMRQNISRVGIFGFEVDADISPLRWLTLFANYTFNHSVINQYIPFDTTVDKDLEGKYLTDVPKHKAAAGVSIKTKPVNVNVLWKYTGARYINDENDTDPYLLTDRYPAYNTVDLRVWRTFFTRLTAGINIENIFDQIFIDDRLQQSPGRLITAEVTFTF
jgi:iron complex outermembrane receptor protein